jgi:hypothetical protein
VEDVIENGRFKIELDFLDLLELLQHHPNFRTGVYFIDYGYLQRNRIKSNILGL